MDGILLGKEDETTETRYYKNGAIKNVVNKKDNSFCEFDENLNIKYLADNQGRFFFSNGKLNSTEDKPAAIYYKNNLKVWYVYGLIHRKDNPAMVYENGTNKWYQFGKLHRTDGPAIERKNGDNEWWENGKFIKCNKITRKIKYFFFGTE